MDSKDQERQSLLETINKLKLEQSVQQAGITPLMLKRASRSRGGDSTRRPAAAAFKERISVADCTLGGLQLAIVEARCVCKCAMNSRHQEEKRQLLKAQEEERKRAKEEAELHMTKCKELSQTAFKQWQQWHKKLEKEKHIRHVQFKRKMESMLNALSKTLEEEHNKREKELQEKFEQKEKDCEQMRDHSEYLDSMVNAVQTNLTVIQDKLKYMNEAVKKSWSDCPSGHWAFNNPANLKPNNLRMKAVGELSDDKDFKEALWNLRRTKYKLSSDVSLDQLDFHRWHSKAHEDAHNGLVEEISFLEEKYITSNTYTPWETSDTGKRFAQSTVRAPPTAS
eukprot:scaffold4383_cov47-Prasinocladus_malaysianus.AAC.1